VKKIVKPSRCLIEKVTQIKADYPVVTAIGGQYGVNHERKKSLTRQIRSRYQKAGRKEKPAILNEFIKTTGYNRKYAPRILNRRETKETVLHTKDGTVKLKPTKKRQANRKGKKIYTEEVIASLCLIWAFFWYKCGKLLAPLMRQQLPFIALWPTFGITADIREKLMKISPATIDRALKKDKAALTLKGKSLTKPGELLKHRIPIRTFYTSEERKLPGFIQIDTVGLQSATTAGRPLQASISSRSPPRMSHRAGFACISSSTRPISGLFRLLKTFTAAFPSPLESSTAITAVNLSTMSSPTGSVTRPALSRSPVHETTKKTIIVLWGRKTEP
jgi:hypothetical protein